MQVHGLCMHVHGCQKMHIHVFKCSYMYVLQSCHSMRETVNSCILQADFESALMYL